MEWLYLVGSIASLISVLLVLLGLARRRKVVNEMTFRTLILLTVTIGFVGIGLIAMFIAPESGMRVAGGFIAVVGTILLFIIGVWALWYTGAKGE